MSPKPKLKHRKPIEKDESLVLIKRVLRENGRKYILRYGMAFGLMAVTALLTGASAWIMKSIINDIFIAKDGRLIWAVAIAVFVIYAGRGFADYGQTVIMNAIGRDIVSDQQRKIYDHLLKHDMTFFNTASLGEVVMYVSQSANSIRQVMNLLLTSLGRDVLSLVSLVYVMVVMDPFLSLFALIIAPGAMFGLRSIKRRIRERGRQEHSGVAHIISSLKDTMLGIRVVKSFGLEQRLRSTMYGLIDTTARQGLKIANLGARSGPMMESLVGVALAATIIYAGYGVIGGARDAGSLLSFLAATLMTYQPAKNLAKLNINLETALIGVGMVYGFLDRKPVMGDEPGAQPIRISEGSVELRNVEFSYGTGNALSGLSVRFPAGKVSALVGSSGAGKSTIFALIERFYDPQKGGVLVDGQDVRAVTVESLRANIAYVTQEAFLFEGSIRDNIIAGRPSATDEEIVAAAKAANAHEFISEHPEGYKRLVGEGGANLSGGQRQRIAIARAMLRNAPILLLDEATSALDAASEAKVREALDTLMKGRTTIVIAHRLSTVRNADVIHVIDSGRLVESGSHDELIRMGGTYAELSALQLSSDGARRAPVPAAAE